MGHPVMLGKDQLGKYESEQVAFVLSRLWGETGVTSWRELVTDIAETMTGGRQPANPMSPFRPGSILPPQAVLVTGIRDLVNRGFITVDGLEPGVDGRVESSSTIQRLEKLKTAGY